MKASPMISKSCVQKEAKRVIRKSRKSVEEFLSEACRTVLEWLNEQPHHGWYSFGPYWWNLRDVLKNHAPKEFLQFVAHAREEESVGEDSSVKSRYDYGRDLLNYAAALMYLEERVNDVTLDTGVPHLVENENGEEKQYVASIGFIEDEEFFE
jgi:hypothetical protein